MKMHAAVEKLRQVADLPLRLPPPERMRLSEANAWLKQKFEQGEPPPAAAALEKIARRIAENIHAGRAGDIARRDWRRLPWCLWLQSYPLAHDEPVLDAYLEWLRKARWNRHYDTLAISYLRDFDAQDRACRRIAAFLKSAAPGSSWQEGQQRFALFSPDQAPGKIAEHVLESGAPVDEALHEVRPALAQADSKLGRDGLHAALVAYRATPEQQLFERVCCWAIPDGEPLPGGSLRGHLANCLLLPWTVNAPPQALQRRSVDFLLQHYKDPRLHPGGWNDVDEDALKVMHGWLARASLEQFLQIVDAIASPALRLQWPYRRAFWKAYERHGLINKAWVVFADRGAHRARLVRDKLPFGRLQRSGVQPNHAVLVLEIGSLRIAEWSENGKCYIWRRGNPAAPELYKDRYVRRELITSSDNGGVVHSASRHGTWQQKVAGFIRNETGIRVQNYRPARN